MRGPADVLLTGPLTPRAAHSERRKAAAEWDRRWRREYTESFDQLDGTLDLFDPLDPPALDDQGRLD